MKCAASTLRELAASPAERSRHWQPHIANRAAFESFQSSARTRLRLMIGAADERLTASPATTSPVTMLGFELLNTLVRCSVAARTPFVTVHHVRWPVLDGVTAEGLLLVPRVIRSAVVALPDADWTPELFCGLEQGLEGRKAE